MKKLGLTITVILFLFAAFGKKNSVDFFAEGPNHGPVGKHDYGKY